LKSKSYRRSFNQEAIKSTLAHIVGIFTIVIYFFIAYQSDIIDPLLVDKYPNNLFALVNHNIVPSMQVLLICAFLLKRNMSLRREVFSDFEFFLLSALKNVNVMFQIKTFKLQNTFFVS